MRHKRTASAVVVLAMAITACGGDSSDSWDWDGDSTRGTEASEWEQTATTAAPWPGDPVEEAAQDPYPDVEFEDPGVDEPEYSDIDRLSTFALDVDTASYTIGRRFLDDGYLPDPDSVRVEEYVNFFAQDYPVPDDGFSITVDGGPTPFAGEDHRIVRIGLRAEDVERRPASDLVFVVDTSGSMEEGGRLEIVKRSLSMLVDQLRADDTVTIVEFGSRASLVLAPTFGDEQRDITAAIASLYPDGSTNFEDGLRMGYDAAERLHEAGRNTRVIVASDGVANVGLTDPEGLVDLIRRDADRGITLVTVGVGMGNYNDVLLEELADDGDGFYAYVDTYEEARDLFVTDLTGTLVTVAEDARIQVEFDPETVAAWRLVGYENRAMADEEFRVDSVDAGEIGAGHTVTALYEIRLTRAALRGEAGRIGRVSLRWLEPVTDDPTEVSQTMTLDDLSGRYRDTSARFQQDVVVAQFAEVLRGSEYAGVWDLRQLAGYAEDVAGMLPRDEQVAEFSDLVRRAAQLES